MEGVELESVHDARACAVRALVELARDVLDGDSRARVLTIEVLDEGGRSQFRGRLCFDTADEEPG